MSRWIQRPFGAKLRSSDTFETQPCHMALWKQAVLMEIPQAGALEVLPARLGTFHSPQHMGTSHIIRTELAAKTTIDDAPLAQRPYPKLSQKERIK